MRLRNHGVTEKTGRHIGVLALLFAAAFFTWTTSAMAEIVFLAGPNGTMRSVDTNNPGSHAVSKAPPDDTTASKAAGVAFNIYYDDVDQNTDIGFDDVSFGTQRRACVVETLTYISQILGRYPDGRTCDVRFDRSVTDGTGSFYEGGAYFSGVSGFVNGFAFEHIQTGIDPSSQLSDMFITMDFGWLWYSDTGTPPAGQLDLRSALLQVLTQGLGMITLAYPDGSSKLPPAKAFSVWDSLLETGAGTRLWTGNPPEFQGTALNLTGNADGVFFLGAKAFEFNEDKPAVYTPSTFDANKSLGFWKQPSDIVGKLIVMKSPPLAPREIVREYSILDQAALYDIGYTNIVMQLAFAEVPRGGWFNVGTRLEMSVRVVGAVAPVSYQWQKNGNNYPGKASSTLVIESLALGNTGNYTCVVTDATGIYDSPAAPVTVFAVGQLPAMGIVGLCLVVAACVLAGALIILRRE